MGYELVIRPRTPDQNLDGPALLARLEVLAREGVSAEVDATAESRESGVESSAESREPVSASPPVHGDAPVEESVDATVESREPVSATPPAPGPSPGEESGTSSPDAKAGGAPAADAQPLGDSAPPPAPAAESWTIRNGEARLSARLFRVKAAIRGADFEVPFGGTEEEFRRVVACLLDAAKSVEGIVFDPQLGKELLAASTDEVVARWRQAQVWAADIAGTAEDHRGVLEFAPPPPLLTRKGKAALLVAGGFLAVYWVLSAVVELLTDVK